MSEIIGMGIIAVGVLFDVLGCIGLIRLPDVYNRLQSATKCVTLGTCLILIGTIVLVPSVSAAVKGLLCLALILITSPTGAHALGRGAYLSGVGLWEKSLIDMYKQERKNMPHLDQ